MRLAFIALALAHVAPLSTLAQEEVRPALVIVYPIEAIPDLRQLNQAKFNERYPGIDVTQIGLVDVGWYVRYTHERLVYLFGPIDERDDARLHKEELEQIRLAATLEEPRLSSSSVDIIRFDYQDTGPPDTRPEERSAEDNPYLIPEGN